MQGGWIGRTYNTLEEATPSLLFQGNFCCGCPEEMATKELSPVPSAQRLILTGEDDYLGSASLFILSAPVEFFFSPK